MEQIFDIVSKMLDNGMYQGNMHTCLRDTGRTAGGFYSSGSLTTEEMGLLRSKAVQLSINKKDGEKMWDEGVSFGGGQPLYPEVGNSNIESGAFDWDYIIPDKIDKGFKLVRREYLEKEDIALGQDYDPKADLIKYISTLFAPEEYCAYCTEVIERDGGKKAPTKGIYKRTAGDILHDLDTMSFEDAIGTIDEEAGAWIRFNPFDGEGVKDENVTDFRYTLIECDDLPIAEQVAIYRELKLPCAFVVHSGGKSAHAIVKINAPTLDIYKQRVDFLYEVCEKNGLKIDKQNRNPSRLSRMPGVKRNGRYQYIIASNIGHETFEEWEDYINDINDELPPISDGSLAITPPPLKPVLIDGILRVGHKARIQGPSKAGKSFALAELAVAIATGTKWLGHLCTKGKVLYVNMEIDEASTFNRFNRIISTIGCLDNEEIENNLNIWNLRGKTISLENLMPKLIRRCKSKGYIAIIFDPIYKLTTGDENSAGDIARFCCLLDTISRECNCSIIDCHHHSKGAQSGKKAMDRSSGSGVFARDPDAIIDMIELNTSAQINLRKEELECSALEALLDDNDMDWRAKWGNEPCISDNVFHFIEVEYPMLSTRARVVRLNASSKLEYSTGWRIEYVLREFAPHKPTCCWFDYPVHVEDESLSGAPTADEGGASVTPKRVSKKVQAREMIVKIIEDWFMAGHDYIRTKEIVGQMLSMGEAKPTPNDILKALDGRIYTYQDGIVTRKDKD